MSPTSGPVAERAPVLNLSDLESMNLGNLRGYAHDAGLTSISGLKKQDLIFRLLQAQAEREGNIFASGLLKIVEDGHGFLRQSNLLAGPNDIYVSLSQIRRFGLRSGDEVTGQVRPPKEAEKYFGLLRVEAVNGMDPDTARLRPHFDELTPIHPTEAFKLESGPHSLAARLVDLFAPVGKGQRGMIAAPPGAGRTILLREVAQGIAQNSPSTHTIVLLVAERPEEVTDMRRTVRGEVLYSTFDDSAVNQVHVAEMAFERARRLVEAGRDVVVLLDSMTRLVRAYSAAATLGGPSFSGELQPSALYATKRLFGTARNVERGGSLTVLATFLVDTGSCADDVIHEEFRGTANLDVVLDRRLLDRSMFPTIDILRSGTRHEELLAENSHLHGIAMLRQMLSALGPVEGAELVLSRLVKSLTNDAFLRSLTEDVA